MATRYLASVTATSRSFLLRADHAAFSRLVMDHQLELVSDLRQLKAGRNRLRLAVTQSIGEHLLLLKPLSTKAGGIHHVGGDLWPDTADPAYRCLLAWLAQAANDTEIQQACTDAYEVLLP